MQDHRRHTEARYLLTRFTDMATSPGHDYGRSSPRYRNTGRPGAGTSRRLPRVPIAIRSSWVTTCGAPRYIRGLGYNVSDSYTTRTYPHQLQLQVHVTPCVHNIRHKYNKLHLGEYSPPPRSRPCIEPPCTPDLSCLLCSLLRATRRV